MLMLSKAGLRAELGCIACGGMYLISVQVSVAVPHRGTRTGRSLRREGLLVGGSLLIRHVVSDLGGGGGVSGAAG